MQGKPGIEPPLVGDRLYHLSHSAWYSQVVSHSTTNQAQPCLACEIGHAQGGMAAVSHCLTLPALEKKTALLIILTFILATGVSTDR